MRKFLCCLFAFAICAVSFAKDYEGVATKVDGDKVTVKVGDKEMVFSTNADTKVVGGAKKDTAASLETLAKFIEKAGEKAKVKVTTAEKDGKEVEKDGKPVAATITAGGKGK